MSLSAVAVVVLALIVVPFAVYVAIARKPPASPEIKASPQRSEAPDPAAQKHGVVFLGDSITAAAANGINVNSSSPPWSRDLTLNPRSPWLESGTVAFPGEETIEVAGRFIRSVDTMTNFDTVAVLLGTNDARNAVPPAVTSSSLTKIVRVAAKHGAKTWVISPPPNDQFTDRQRAVVDLERRVAKADGARFIDLFASRRLGNPDGTWRAGLTVDGIHPNGKGQRAIAAVVLKAITAAG